MSDCLIVDDSAVIRKVVVRILTSFGLSVTEAGDAGEGLLACRREMPRLILLDGMMPGLSGVDFLVKLRKMERGKEPKVVFCTTDNDVAQIARAYRAGANLYVQKPFDRDILLAKLTEAGILPQVA